MESLRFKETREVHEKNAWFPIDTIDVPRSREEREVQAQNA